MGRVQGDFFERHHAFRTLVHGACVSGPGLALRLSDDSHPFLSNKDCDGLVGLAATSSLFLPCTLACYTAVKAH
jgi:hypothetical protein